MSVIVRGVIESDSFVADAAPKVWAMFELRTPKQSSPSANARSLFGGDYRPEDVLTSDSTAPVDFVVAIDISASMRVDSKLSFIQATMEFLLSKLSDRQTFSLIAFNHEIYVLAELLPCSASNKKKVLELIHGLEASGSTNISEALFTGTRILLGRPEPALKRVSSLMLFTDGLSNQGLSSMETLASLAKIRMPAGCVFNTFGYGSDHDSKLLHAIAHEAQGVYYFVENKEEIASTFGECVAGLLTTQAHDITVSLKCSDGSRLITLATPFKIRERMVAKQYDVNLELMYRGESKCILFRLSLRKFPRAVDRQVLIQAEVSYTNTLTGVRESLLSAPLVVARPDISLASSLPLDLSWHINRYAAASTIKESIEHSKKGNFAQAQSALQAVTLDIKCSPSGSLPVCQDLCLDLDDCLQVMENKVIFEARGVHFAHALASMYFMERSSGFSSRLRTRASTSFLRHVGYGYVTADQEEAAHCSVLYVSSHVAGDVHA